MRLLDLRYHHGCNPGIRYHLCHLCPKFHLTLMDLEIEHWTDAAVDVYMALTLLFSRHSQSIRKVPPSSLLPFTSLMSAFNGWSLMCINQNPSHKGFGETKFIALSLLRRLNKKWNWMLKAS